MLQSDDRFIRTAAIVTLMHIGPAASQYAIPVLKDSFWRIRIEPTYTIIHEPGPQWSPWVTPLLEALDSETINQYYIIMALGKIGKPAAPAIPKLQTYKSGPIADAAKQAIQQIEGAQ